MKSNGNAFAQELARVTRAAVSDATEYLLETANRTAPIEEGTLIGSGTATVEQDPTTTRGVVAYDTPYAVRQHEDTRLRHDAGRRAKWLERTADEEAATIGRLIEGRLAQVAR